MDIKIRARLSAYSKIASVEGVNTSLPFVGKGDAGSVVGVSAEGSYTLFPTVGKEQVDEMFVDSPNPTTVEKDDIDTLFKETEEPVSVTKAEIDSLFEKDTKPESVGKEDIDTLFNDKGQTIGTVSFAEIDSLFK